MASIMWLATALAALFIFMWWTHKLSRDVICAVEAHANRGDISDLLDSDYPVFSRAGIIDAYQSSVTASRHLQAIEGAVLRDQAFNLAANGHQIPNDVSERMLEVARATVDAERAWHRHSVMMDANVSVLSGRQLRDEALARAEQRFDLVPISFGLESDAQKLRDEWKARLENPKAPVVDPSPRPYTNPWSTFAKQRLFHWMK